MGSGKFVGSGKFRFVHCKFSLKLSPVLLPRMKIRKKMHKNMKLTIK